MTRVCACHIEAGCRIMLDFAYPRPTSKTTRIANDETAEQTSQPQQRAAVK